MNEIYSALMRSLLSITVFVGLGGCAIATPFRGPGYEAGKGVKGVAPEQIIVVVLTNAEVRAARRTEFDRNTDAVLNGLGNQPGYIAHSIRRELFGNRVWTMTAWMSEAARAEFVASSAHGLAIGLAPDLLTSARFHRMEIKAGELPLPWARALQLLETAGRRYQFAEAKVQTSR